MKQRALISAAALISAVGCVSAQQVPAKPEAPIQSMPSGTDAGPITPAAFDTTIARLGSESFAEREAATQALLNAEGLTLDMLEGHLRSRTLTAEQRSRLIVACRQKFMETPRAAMGVQFGGNLLDWVVIGKTFEKFPSFRLLQPGDIITEAGGQRLYGSYARDILQGLIIAHDPGDVLPVTIRRGPEKLKVDLPLGRFNDLEGNVLDEYRLMRGWQTRSGWYSAPDTSGSIIGAGLKPDDWKESQVLMRRLYKETLKYKGIEGTAPQVMGAGSARDRSNSGADARAILAQQQWPMQRRVGNGRQQFGMVQGGRLRAPAFEPDFDGAPPPMPIARALELLEASELKLGQELTALRSQVSEPGNEGILRRAVADQISERERAIEIIGKQRQALLAEQAEQSASGQAAAGSDTPGKE